MKSVNLTKVRHLMSLFSVLLMLLCVALIGIRGFNLGLDFTGGAYAEVAMATDTQVNAIETALQSVAKGSLSVVETEPGRFVIRMGNQLDSAGLDNLKAALFKVDESMQLLDSDSVSSQVGEELYEQGGLAVLVAMLCIMGYLSLRFEWRLACGALLALVHDVVLVLGVFALTGMEFNLTVLAAVLAVLGYSLNDSIIIADRMRELLRAKPELKVTQINNDAVAQTFSRTMVTSGTTLMTVGALWLLGGDALEGFAIAMFVGIVTGTLSSISVGTVLPELLGIKPPSPEPVLADTP
ncbi:protein translocase subunit SecF [Shewanella sp. JM162201]|uniref:Protein-export membrane protein SecF n=1 Tax=Shewanella jiangmenensis TaxID=2837387 RepID=A0ABS5V084_9GAMM|nr:protein translocase subunit SecF [Shewanella jiangmenensis]MBT1443318.1 protein translocase subunit SecF [Shewanella jiangmenensis]